MSASSSHVIGQAIDGGNRFVVLSPKTGILKERLRLTKPRKITRQVNGKTTTSVTSDFYYVDDTGKNCRPPTTIWCPQQSWTSMSFKYMSAESTWVEENAVGFKVTYPLQRDVEEPTSEEKFTKKSSDTIYDVVYESFTEFKDDLPFECKTIFKKAEKLKDRSQAIRPLFTPRAVSKTDKTIDTSKSKVMYIDFSVFGPKDDKGNPATGRGLKCLTKITGPKNSSLNPFDICDKFGRVGVVIEWLGVNYNCGGTTSKMAAIIKYKLNQITWSPSGPVSIPLQLTNDDAGEEAEETPAGKDNQVDQGGQDDDLSSGDDAEEPEFDPFETKKGKSSSEEDVQEEPEPEPEPPKRMTAAERRAALQKKK